MKYLLIFLCLFLAACDDLPKSGGNTGAYWYMKGWKTLKPGEPGQIPVVENGELVWRFPKEATEIREIETIGVQR